MKSRSTVLSLFAALLLLALVVSPAVFGASREFSQVYPLRADGTLELTNVNGAVRVEVWDKEAVEVRAVKSTPEREALLDLVAIDIDSRPDSLSIATRYPFDGGIEVAVDYTLRVPRHARLTRLSTVNGTLRITDATSIGDLHTVNGNIEVYEGSGDIRARTTNGNVYLEWRQEAETHGASAETTNGSVVLVIPAGIRADVEAHCMNGSFSSDLPFVMQGSDQQRVLHGQLGNGGVPIRLGTVNGTIHIAAAKSTI